MSAGFALTVASADRADERRVVSEPMGDYVTRGQTEQSQWVTYFTPQPAASARLFCFPYAGGGARVFQSWGEAFAPAVEVCAILLPGRERRLREPPFTRLDALARAVVVALRPYLDKPYALYGHSMGAKICFELARQLRRERAPLPAHLLVSGCRPPQLPSEEAPNHTLPEPEFLDKLRQLNGTPREVLEHPELMQLLLPVLRADFEAVETYDFTPEPPFAFPVTAYGGLQDDEVSREHLEAWREHTSADFVVRMLPGDHFFLNSNQRLFLHTLARDLLRTPGLYAAGTPR